MFGFLDKAAHDDNLLKSVFDYVRNVGIIGLVGAAAAWKQKHVAPGWQGWFDYLTIGVLVAVTVILTYILQENLFSKIRNNNLYTKRAKVIFILLYTIAFNQILVYVQNGKS